MSGGVSIRRISFRFGIAVLLTAVILVAVFIRSIQQPAAQLSFSELSFHSDESTESGPPLLPLYIRSLESQRVSISGYISPHSVYSNHGITKFILVPDTMSMVPNYTEFLIVHLTGDATTSFTVKPITVTGRFRILDPPFRVGDLSTHFQIDEDQVGIVGEPSFAGELPKSRF